MVVPDNLVDAARARMDNLFLTPPSLAQHAALIAFDCRDGLKGHIETYPRNFGHLLQALPQIWLRRFAPPDGAFIYADVSHLTDDSLSFCQALLHDTGVAVAPGLDFDPINGNGFIRFSFAASSDLITDAIRCIAPWCSVNPLLLSTSKMSSPSPTIEIGGATVPNQILINFRFRSLCLRSGDTVTIRTKTGRYAYGPLRDVQSTGICQKRTAAAAELQT